MIKRFLGLLILIASTGNLCSQGIAVNTTGVQADGSSLLDLSASNKGLLIPRLTTAQRDQMVLPAVALLIFNSDVMQFQVNTGTPAAPGWQNIVSLPAGSSSWNTSGNSTLPDTAYLGTDEARPLRFKTHNVLRLFIDSANTRVGIGTDNPRTSLEVSATDALIVPVGTTAQRPLQPVVGMIRFNATTGKLEGFTSAGWMALH